MISENELLEALASWPTLDSLQDRLAVVQIVAEYWHGPLTATPSPRDINAKQPDLPAALTWFHQTFGGHDHVHSYFNQLTQPSRLHSDPGGYVPFYAECQGVFRWAIRLDGDDPPVFGRGREEDRPWKLQMDRLTGFFLFAITFEALYQTRWSAHGTMPLRAFSQLCTPLLKADTGHSLWMNGRCDLYQGNGLTVWAWEINQDETRPVIVGSLAEGPVQRATTEGDWVQNWESGV